MLASFLGIGLGVLSARRPQFRFPSFPILLFALTVVVALNRFELHIASTDVLYFGAGAKGFAQAETFILLPLIFTFVAAAFIPLARSLGALFTETLPLTAYAYGHSRKSGGDRRLLFSQLLLVRPDLVVCDSRLARAAANDASSSYRERALIVHQRRDRALSATRDLLVALLQDYTDAGFAFRLRSRRQQHRASEHDPLANKRSRSTGVFTNCFPDTVFENALILGAGTGSDTATALAHGVKHITAVEIDPVIQKLGTQFHPDQPYSDPRVRAVVNDGRVFLRNTREKFDLIIFALPDSLTLTSSIANLRLESFLFTQDSLGNARDALAPNGLLVLYNYYREPWLIEKLAGMVSRTFGQPSFVSTYGGHGRAAAIINGSQFNGAKFPAVSRRSVTADGERIARDRRRFNAGGQSKASDR